MNEKDKQTLLKAASICRSFINVAPLFVVLTEPHMSEESKASAIQIREEVAEAEEIIKELQRMADDNS